MTQESWRAPNDERQNGSAVTVPSVNAAPAGNPVPQYPANDVGTATGEEELQRYLRMYRAQPIERGYRIPAADVQVC